MTDDDAQLIFWDQAAFIWRPEGHELTVPIHPWITPRVIHVLEPELFRRLHGLLDSRLKGMTVESDHPRYGRMTLVVEDLWYTEPEALRQLVEASFSEMLEVARTQIQRDDDGQAKWVAGLLGRPEPPEASAS